MLGKIFTQSFLTTLPCVICALFYIVNGQSQAPCFWSKCFLSGNTGSPCPNDYMNTTSKTCFWGSGTMYQCCKIASTTPSESEGSTPSEVVPGASESSYTTESSSASEPVPTTETEGVSTESEIPTTPEPVNLLQCELVKPKQYPFIVALLMEQNEGQVIHFCSGAIVSEWHVLTSASCVANKLAVTIDASAANLNLTYFEYTEQTITVKDIHVHSDFKSDDPTRKSDLAILEMKHPFRMWSEYVQPVRIAPDATYVDHLGNSGTVTGWEIQDLNGNGSSALYKVDVPFVPRSECADLYRDLAEPLGQSKIDIQKQFCATSSQVRNECVEDYGSPMITRNSDGVHYIVGISAIHSNLDQVPNVYTDITYFREFIYNIIAPKDTSV